MEFDRADIIVALPGGGARILVRTGGRPIERYAVMLQALVDGEWRTVRLIDNHLDRHHMHRYDGDVKGEPESFAHGAVREVIPQAIGYMKDHHRAILDSWTR